MFDSKQKSLFSTSSNNSFVNSAMKQSSRTLSGNGAEKFSSSGNSFVDQFSSLSIYRKPRPFSEIEKDCETSWAENKELAVKFALYLRVIPREVKFFDGTSTQEVQKGGELKHEAIMRFLWLHHKDSETFWNNIGLFIAAGSWHDVFTMLQYDLVHHGWKGRVLNWEKFGNLILSGLENSNTVNLVKKYLPQIKTKSACSTVESQANTLIGKWVCSLLFGSKENSYTYKQYRKLKASGTAHEWQQLISRKQFERIDFGKIHGRALNLLVRSKFLENQGLKEKYTEWAKKPEQKEIKYTGFVHELFQNLPQGIHNVEESTQLTINGQFNTLVSKGRPEKASKLIVVRDTSGSMKSIATGTKSSSFDIAKALALYFSEFLTGYFSDCFIEFNSGAVLHKWKGNSPIEKWFNDKCDAYGSTNFQGVINLFVQLKNQGIPEEDFPTGILCVSDGEFNPAQLGKTNVQTSLEKLKNAGFSKEYLEKFTIILWNIPNGYYGNPRVTFETFNDVPNVFYMSGYSASNVSFAINNEIKTANDLFLEAMNQELLNRVKV